MYPFDFNNLKPGAVVHLVDDPDRADTRELLAALREAWGDAVAPILAGTWELVERLSAAGSPSPRGVMARLRSPGGHELVVHRTDLRLPTARTTLRVVAPAPAQPSAPPVVEPPRCDDRLRPGHWKHNRKVGAVYVEAGLGGTARVSLVAVQGDGTSRCEAEIRGLAPNEVERTAAMFAARLAGRVAPEAAREA